MTESDADFKTTIPGYGRQASQFAGVGVDPLEAAVNRGAINAFYRTGRVIYVDGFEVGNLEPWVQATDGTGALARVTTKSFFGEASVEFSTLNPNDTAILEKDFPFIETGLHGIEIAVAFGGGDVFGDSPEFEFHSVFYDGTNGNGFGIKLNPNPNGNAELYVYEEPTTWTLVTAALQRLTAIDDNRYHLIKLVVDPVELAYKYVRINGAVHNLSSYDQNVFASAVAPHWTAQMVSEAGALTPTTEIYIDNFIATVNELDIPFE